MKRGETTASARRVGPLRALDANGDPVLAEDFSGAGELEVSLGGAAFAVGGGTVGEIGGGYYYYEPPPAETLGALWLAVKLAGVCEEFTFREDLEVVPNGIVVGEADPDNRRVGPLFAVDADGNKLDAAALAGVTTEVSINGSAWAAAAGALAMNDDGYPYYEATQAEVGARGWIAVKMDGACQQFILREDIVDPPATAESPDEAPSGTPVPVVHDNIPVINHVALALSRLPQQYRGDDDVPTELLAP